MNNIAKKIVTETSNYTVMNGNRTAYSEADYFKEYAYYQAEQLAKRLLQEGLINVDEYDKLCAENQLIFSPFLAEIMS